MAKFIDYTRILALPFMVLFALKSHLLYFLAISGKQHPKTSQHCSFSFFLFSTVFFSAAEPVQDDCTLSDTSSSLSNGNAICEK